MTHTTRKAAVLGTRRLRSMIQTLVAAAAAIGVVGCDKSPTTPSGNRLTPITPSFPIVRIEIVAPVAIAPGESAQLTANAVKSDGSLENVTTQTIWSSTNPKVIEISAAGMATAVAAGETTFIARHLNRSATARTLVLPSGTYRLQGRVLENGFGLEGVSVNVISGVGSGMTVLSATGGGYALYGVRGPIQIEAKKAGYHNRLVALDVADHQTLELEITAGDGRPDVRGTYALTLDAAPCDYVFGVMPAATLHRAYTANVEQDGSRLKVMLSGGDFVITRDRGNHFSGFLEPNGFATFTIGDTYYYYDNGQHDVVERISESTTLLVTGIATANATGSGMSGRLAGVFMLARGTTAPFTNLLANCYSGVHRFEMVRR